MDFIEVRTHHTFLETSISKYDTGPVNLPGLSRNAPLLLSPVNSRAEVSPLTSQS